jgi:hypothetical protein
VNAPSSKFHFFKNSKKWRAAIGFGHWDYIIEEKAELQRANHRRRRSRAGRFDVSMRYFPCSQK